MIKLDQQRKISRDQDLIKLVEQVKHSAFKATAIKVEFEGNIGRKDNCGASCQRRSVYRAEIHPGCKYFPDAKVANDFLLEYLSQFGLAERADGGFTLNGRQESWYWKPVAPLVFTRLYSDSETEWTITLSLDQPENILLLPKFVDAFNALAKANKTKKINVEGSGMHMAFLQGTNGYYPTNDDQEPMNRKRFSNFQKSMTPLLPALYFLGTNRMYRQKAITRSLDPRQPMISSEEKYSAIAYRSGALEFRVFDTCYDNRDQILDNAATMARSVSKYWRKQYRDPGMAKFLKKPVYFGGKMVSSRINNLEDCFQVREQLDLLNAGLARIKPPYYTISEIKKVRRFKKNGHNCKGLDVSKYTTRYEEYIRETKWSINHDIAREFYYAVDRMNASEFNDDPKELAKLRQKITRKISKKHPIKPVEEVVFEHVFGRAYLIGGKA